MKKKSTPPCAFFSVRALVALLLCAGACCIVTGTLLAFFRSEAPVTLSQRTLTFAERVAYQRAIENVYWRHRIWPKQRPDPKPSLDAVLSQAQLERKVTDYLRKSQALEIYWQRPITAEQLQAEMDRMAKHTKQPEMLRELFEALGNDPFVIAECLARPALAERGASYSFGQESKPTGYNEGRPAAANYSLPTVLNAAGECSEDTWTPTTLTNAPTGRTSQTAVWTGSEMIIWGGGDGNALSTGGRYNLSTDTWAATSTIAAPLGRGHHSAVWTGSEMIVWGGDNGSLFDTGGRYNPATDGWTPVNTINAPSARSYHSAVWAGSEMVVWGGYDGVSLVNSGGKYNPGTDSWTATSTTNAPGGRYHHTAVWTGSEMIVWGGTDGAGNYFNTGGRYNPSTGSWTSTTISNAPSARGYHTAVWADSIMIVWGGYDGTDSFNTGGKYSPGSNSWTATSTANAPAARNSHRTVWTGSEMIVWGGGGEASPFYYDTGGRYNPDINSWVATSTINAPIGRADPTAVWTGSEMIVWGGFFFDGNFHYLNTGGSYCAQSGPTPTPTASPTSTATPTATSTPSGTPTVTATPSTTPRVTPTPRAHPSPRARPASPPHITPVPPPSSPRPTPAPRP